MKSGTGAHFRGVAAEEAAARLYLDEGGRVLATRWRCREGEIDLIVAVAGVTVFVEVKARRDRDAAAAALAPAQRRRLAAAAARWVGENPAAQDCRFDVVLVDGGGRAERIENALSFEDW